MRNLIGLAAFATVTLIGIAPAAAWDGPGLWYKPIDGPDPGGGGILGTGGAHDHGIKCADCHVERDPTEVIDLQFDFQPALGSAGPDLVYAPGQRYRVDVRMLGAQLGTSCGEAVMKNVDQFAAGFETDTGAPAGALESDSGQSAASCPATFPNPAPSGTTGLAADCEVVFSLGTEDTTQWTFYWTAPASGTVKLFYGGVDGDCDMMSMKDATVDGSRVLRAQTVAGRRSVRHRARDPLREHLALGQRRPGIPRRHPFVGRGRARRGGLVDVIAHRPDTRAR